MSKMKRKTLEEVRHQTKKEETTPRRKAPHQKEGQHKEKREIEEKRKLKVKDIGKEAYGGEEGRIESE